MLNNECQAVTTADSSTTVENPREVRRHNTNAPVSSSVICLLEMAEKKLVQLSMDVDRLCKDNRASDNVNSALYIAQQIRAELSKHCC